MEKSKRDCSALIAALYDGTHEADKNFIKHITRRKDIFLGIRDKSIKLYAYGAKALEISITKNEISYKTNAKYSPLNKEKLTLQECTDNFDYIVKNAGGVYLNQHKHEKICQQWIANSYNNHDSESFYFVDMEYENSSINFGRPDLVAISKSPNKKSGKHSVYLIELKTGKSNIGGSWIENGQEINNNLERFYQNNISYGSGVVGHIADDLRFLYGNYYKILQENIKRILKCQKQLEYLYNKEWAQEIDSIELEDYPIFVIVCYTNTPSDAYMEGVDTKDRQSKILINEIKNELRKYLFDIKDFSSSYNLEKRLPREIFQPFASLKTNKYLEDCFEIKQTVSNKEYSFIFKFMDADSETSWRCL